MHEAQQGLADALREFKEAQLELQRQSSLVNQASSLISHLW